MALQKLTGGPDWDVVTNPDYALFADFHYFILSGSTERSNPWNSPPTPIAKVLNVTNTTANSVVANYVSSSGELTNVILTSGSTAQITSQTIPLGLDNNAWLSASIVSDFTGSVTARPTGSRWFELESIRSISQDTYVYTIADGATTITRTNTGQPSVGSLRYRCSRTIPYVDNGWWIIRDLYDCTGGTTTTTTTTTSTTTTTAAPTTTTTTVAPFCTVYTASNAFGAGYEIKVKYCGDTTYSFPTVPPNSSIYVCVQNDDITNNGNPITITSSSVACSGSIITTTTTTAAPTTTTTSTTTTTTAAPTTTTTLAPTTTTTSTTTTTTLASQKYYIESCIGPADISGIFTILNAPLLNTGAVIRISGGIAGYYCFVVYGTSTGTSVGSYSITDVWQDAAGDCDVCSE
jgi:hypothetical protein